MATYITIVDTAKTGWLTVDTNALFASGAIATKQLNIIKSSVNAVDIMKDTLGNLYLEVHTNNIAPPYFISNDTSQTRYYPIESVNGVAPSDMDDLKNKILALL